MIVGEVSDQEAAEREIHEALAAERLADRQGATAFAHACRVGDVKGLLWATDFLNQNTIGGWRLAMRRVGNLPSVSDEIRAAFLSIWVEAKHLPLKVGDRATMARALHVLMPPVTLARPLLLYRGTTAWERSRGAYGFSWSTEREVAERFAEQASAATCGGILLTTVAKSGAVHLRREEEGYYDEGEVVVDPYRLGQVNVVARLPSGQRS